MRGLLQMMVYHVKVWLARRWCDPYLAELAERHGGVYITSQRFGKVLVPMYCVAGEFSATLAQRLHDMTAQRDHWKRRAESESGCASRKV